MAEVMASLKAGLDDGDPEVGAAEPSRHPRRGMRIFFPGQRDEERWKPVARRQSENVGASLKPVTSRP